MFGAPFRSYALALVLLVGSITAPSSASLIFPPPIGTLIQPILDSAPSQIRAGRFILGTALAVLDTCINGFPFDETHYLRRILGLFLPRKLLFVQRHNLSFPQGKASLTLHLFSPQSVEGQEVLWQGCMANTPFTQTGNKITVFPAGTSQVSITVCSLVKTRFINHPDVFNVSFRSGSSRKSFSSRISASLTTMRDLYEFVNFFGTYAPNEELLPIESILINPFNIDCSEFSTIVLEVLRDKNIPAKYALGITSLLPEGPKTMAHCWVRALLQGKEVDIDPTSGRRLGQIAYGCKLPFVVYMGSVETLDEMRFFPISVITEEPKEMRSRIAHTAEYYVYTLMGGF